MSTFWVRSDSLLLLFLMLFSFVWNLIPQTQLVADGFSSDYDSDCLLLCVIVSAVIVIAVSIYLLYLFVVKPQII